MSELKGDVHAAAVELLVNLGMAQDRLELQREYMELMRFTAPGEDAPFFTEGYLYELLGKDDARTLLSLVRRLLEAAGVPATESYEWSCLADRTQRCEFCYGDGNRREEICTICNGNGWRAIEEEDDG